MAKEEVSKCSTPGVSNSNSHWAKIINWEEAMSQKFTAIISHQICYVETFDMETNFSLA